MTRTTIVETQDVDFAAFLSSMIALPKIIRKVGDTQDTYWFKATEHLLAAIEYYGDGSRHIGTPTVERFKRLYFTPTQRLTRSNLKSE